MLNVKPLYLFLGGKFVYHQQYFFMAKTTAKRKTTGKTAPKNSVQDKVKIVENYLSKKYHFRYNPISDRTEFKTIKAKEFNPLTERDINSMFRELNHKSVSIQMNMLKSILNSDFIPTSDPFKDVLTP